SYGDDDEGSFSGVVGIFLALLTPIGASLIQMAISREREFQADYSAGKTIGSGSSLASALVAIHESAIHSPMHRNPALTSLYIGDPLGGWGGKLLHLFSTHPPVEERVKRLQQI